MKKFSILLLIVFTVNFTDAQWYSDLSATSGDPLFTTYAAPPERSEYISDQGYRFKWNDPETNPEFISKQGPNFGIAFGRENAILISLERYFQQPVITASYSDLVRYNCYPYKGIRCETFFDVWSSEVAFMDIILKNETSFQQELEVYPYLWISGDTVNDIRRESSDNSILFRFRKPKDGWMTEHAIPVAEDMEGSFSANIRFDSLTTFAGKATDKPAGIADRIINQSLKTKKEAKNIKGVAGCRHLRLSPGDVFRFRIVCRVSHQNIKNRKNLPLPEIYKIDTEKLISSDIENYRKIPVPKGVSEDYKLFYLSCFSLMRQCMMPPEGNAKFNYYVFSREPRWGWGYGGQVFHESLSMLAYAFMDPAGAMNSQRLYMSRQYKNGYIPYRTGPYLNEDIPYDSTLTTSAPWYNYENLEIYKITGDRSFLKEAYESGSKFYRFYVAARDSNNNGLCEWGGEASLESVRDARVAVWDQVGWPSNFEGPDLNSMLVREASSLAEMAKVLGKNIEAAEWKKDAEKRSGLVNKVMWDSLTGFYYNVNRNDQSFSYKNENDLKIQEIIGFLPYWAGITNSSQEEKLIKNLKDPEKFWRPYGVPSLSADESYYNGIGYWNGPVWVQWDYLIFRGLLEHVDTADAKILAEKIIDNMIWHLKKDHTFWEFYSPDKNQAGWNQTYIWAGIAARFLIDLQMTQPNIRK